MVVQRYDGGLLGTVWGTWDYFWQETNIAGANNAGKARGGAPYIRYGLKCEVNSNNFWSYLK